MTLERRVGACSDAISSLVAVTSTVWKVVTCGAVKALRTIASAVCLRTPADRDAGGAFPRRRRGRERHGATVGAALRRADADSRRIGLDIGAGDQSGRPSPRRGRGRPRAPWRACARAAWTAAARPALETSLRVDHIVRRRLENGGVGLRGGRAPRACAALRATRAAGRGAVADEVRLAFSSVGGSAASSRADDRRPARRARSRRPRRRRTRSARSPTSTTSPAAACSVVDRRRRTARQLDDRLGGLDLGDRLVERDGVALGDQPLHELCLGESLAEVRQPEFGDQSGPRSRRSAPDSASSTQLRQAVRPVQHAVDAVQDPVEVGQVVLLELRRRVRDVVAGDAHGRRLEVVEARSVTLAISSAPTPASRAASCVTTTRPVLRTDAVDRAVVDGRDRAQVDDLDRDALVLGGGRGIHRRRRPAHRRSAA